jgi:hypothetical protein
MGIELIQPGRHSFELARRRFRSLQFPRCSLCPRHLRTSPGNFSSPQRLECHCGASASAERWMASAARPMQAGSASDNNPASTAKATYRMAYVRADGKVGRLATLPTLRPFPLAGTHRPRPTAESVFAETAASAARVRWCFESSVTFGHWLALDATLLFLQNFIELGDKLKKFSGVLFGGGKLCNCLPVAVNAVGHFGKFPSRSVIASQLVHQRL